MGFSLKKMLAPAAAIMNPVAAIGSLASIGGDIYSAQQQARNVEKSNQTNVYLAGQEMAFNATEAEKARQFSAGQAKQQMEFQERMSDTQYQRAMADMKSAGLNPMLAYAQGGAGTPSGAMGSAPMATGDRATVTPVPSKLAGVMSGARDMMSLYAQVRTAVENWKNIEADTAKKESESLVNWQNADLLTYKNKMTMNDYIRQQRAMSWEDKHPDIAGLMDAIEKRLGVFNSALSVFGKGSQMILNDGGQ